MRVELLTVGDELLLGDTVNGNAAWLGRMLTAAGAQPDRAVTVRDEIEVIADAVAAALRRADAVIVTGGLGATSDDLTRDALALLAGVPLLPDPEIELLLAEKAAERGVPLHPMTARMALVPEGAALIGNSAGSAPGLRLTLADGVVYALPGVPAEMRAMMTEHVLPEIAAAAPGGGPLRRTLRVAGRYETEVATALAPVEALPDVQVAYLPAAGQVRVRLTATGPEALTMLQGAEELARELLGSAVYGADDDTLDHVVHRLLAERNATVAVAESLTGGLIGAELTAMPGASATYAGGLVVYATDLKASLLGVAPHLLAAEGAVHPQVAAAMATGVRDRLGASYGLAVTGVAGPEPQDGRAVGTVFVAVAGPGSDPVVESPRQSRGSAGAERREIIRRSTVTYALDLLRRSILGLAPAVGSAVRPGEREGFT